MNYNQAEQEYRKLNDFIRGEMKRKKISQIKLAESLNLSQVAISNRLKGETEWGLKEVISLFEVLGVEHEWTC